MDYPQYATTTDLATYLGITVQNLPTDSQRLLTRASELIQHATLGNIDSTKSNHVNAAKLAVCAQVEYWIDMGEGISTSSGYQSLGIGSFNVNYGNNNSQSILSVRGRQYLNNEGLLNREVRVSVNSWDSYDSDLHN